MKIKIQKSSATQTSICKNTFIIWIASFYLVYEYIHLTTVLQVSFFIITIQDIHHQMVYVWTPDRQFSGEIHI